MVVPFRLPAVLRAYFALPREIRDVAVDRTGSLTPPLPTASTSAVRSRRWYGGASLRPRRGFQRRCRLGVTRVCRLAGGWQGEVVGVVHKVEEVLFAADLLERFL
jgi:hypothetical protein